MSTHAVRIVSYAHAQGMLACTQQVASTPAEEYGVNKLGLVQNLVLLKLHTLKLNEQCTISCVRACVCKHLPGGCCERTRENGAHTHGKDQAHEQQTTGGESRASARVRVRACECAREIIKAYLYNQSV
eukprot:1439376-Pleurochrysis_carterae.AAC.3